MEDSCGDEQALPACTPLPEDRGLLYLSLQAHQTVIKVHQVQSGQGRYRVVYSL